MITRRTKRLGLALLLPLLVLRALLPAGYMPVAEHGQLRIVMCSAGLALSADDHTDGSNPRLPPNAGDCPFAHAPAGAPPLQMATLAAPSLEIQPVPSDFRPLFLPPGPRRAHAARAPPLRA